MESDYLNYQQTLDFLEACYQKHNFVYGLERFILDGSKVKPDLDGILDLSAICTKDVAKSIEAAKLYLSQYGNDTDEAFTVITES